MRHKWAITKKLIFFSDSKRNLDNLISHLLDINSNDAVLDPLQHVHDRDHDPHGGDLLWQGDLLQLQAQAVHHDLQAVPGILYKESHSHPTKHRS